MLLKTYLIALPTFFVIDILWLAFIAKDFYAKQIGYIMAPSINWIAAISFYFIFVFGLALFVIVPATEKGDWSKALLQGALFGIVTYSAYDLTNLATLKDWPLLVTIVDLAWGAVIGSTVSIVTFGIVRHFWES